jgi:hypothetical protein
MKITIRQINDVTIADISGRIVLGEECATLRDVVRGLLEKGRRKTTSIVRESIWFR